MSELFDGSVTPSLRHPGLVIACCCVVQRVVRLIGVPCPTCVGGEHPQCTDPGYLEADKL